MADIDGHASRGPPGVFECVSSLIEPVLTGIPERRGEFFRRFSAFSECPDPFGEAGQGGSGWREADSR